MIRRLAHRPQETAHREEERGPSREPTHQKPRPGNNGRGIRFLVRALRGVYVLVGLLMVLGLCYLFGHPLLEGALSGNDIPWALSMVQWYDRWFPSLPAWFPLEGAGTPLLYLYQPGTSLLVVLVHRVSGLTDIQAFRLLAFLSIPLAATGIYFLVWIKARSQTAALLAGLLYPLSAASWDWLTRIGLYAQSVTIMYVPWAFVVFDAYVSLGRAESTSKGRLKQGALFSLAAFLFAVMFTSHLPTALVFLMGISGYTLMLPWFEMRKSRPWREMVILTLKAWAAAFAGLLLVAAWVVPWLHSNALANREGLSYIPAEQISSYDFATTLGLATPDPAYRMTFAAVVVALAAVGLVAGLVRRETPATWGVLSLGSVLFVAMPQLWMGFVRVFAPLWEATNDRAVLLAILLMPAIAAYGAIAVGRLVMWVPSRLVSLAIARRTANVSVHSFGGVVRQVGIAVVALAVAGAGVLYGPALLRDRNGYGPQYGDGAFPISVLNGHLVLPDPPLWELSQEGDLTNRADILNFTQSLGMDGSTRLDVSPDLGGITEALSLYSDASIVNIYGFNASLIHAMWAYQATVFYMSHYGSAEEVNELARWFGLQYVILHRDLDPLERYEPSLWPIVYPETQDPPTPVQVRRFAEAPAMASLLSKPVVLVIGGFENAIYEQAFKTFVRGALTYDRGLVVEGTHNIDDYSLEELRRFDAVFLHGYGYKSGERAWRLLEQYVAEGGALYVDTGWQFFTPDWQTEHAPEVLPVANLAWTHFGAGDMLQVEDPSIAGDIRAESFSPLIWQGQPWGFSTSPSGLRDWAHPVLSVMGIPIIAAGEYGEGRVVWSGMNLIGHAATYDNAAERRLLGQLLAWLVPSRGADEMPAPEVVRENPDHLRFVLGDPPSGRTTLLWREAYSPDWHASAVVDGRRVDIPIYRAGPGMMLLMLPPIDTPGAVIEMGYSLGWLGVAGNLVSFATLAVLATSTLFPRPWEKLALRLRRRRTRTRAEGNVPWMSKPSTGTDVQTGGSSGSWSEETPHDRMADQPDENGLGSLEGGIDDDEQVRALWESFQASAATTGQGLEGADQMIKWWRKARAPRTGESADEDPAPDGTM